MQVCYFGTLLGDKVFLVASVQICHLNTLSSDKDDLFAQSALLEGKYKFSKEDVSAKDWPEYSFWEGSLKRDEL